MTRYMPLTGIDLIPASLFIDTEAPFDVLQAAADYRILMVKQVLETLPSAPSVLATRRC